MTEETREKRARKAASKTSLNAHTDLSCNEIRDLFRYATDDQVERMREIRGYDVARHLIRIEIKERKWSQRELADHLGYSKSTVDAILSDTRLRKGKQLHWGALFMTLYLLEISPPEELKERAKEYKFD